MRYLDLDRLESIDVEAFRATKPYPWVNPTGVLTDRGFDALLEGLPDLSLFERRFGLPRKTGQAPHDRYSLEYTDAVPVSTPWREFLRELRGERYRRSMRRLLGGRRIDFRFHWHYTPAGCSISPHVDSSRELGSQIFYFNPESEWDPAWGGQTLVLDSAERPDPRSAPELEDFDHVTPADCVGNRSLLFARRDDSWHAMSPLGCPPDRLRRVFIVVVNASTVYWRTRDAILRKRKPLY